MTYGTKPRGFAGGQRGLSAPPYRYRVDPELGIIHLFKDCEGLKVALRYNYATEIEVRDADDAAKLDDPKLRPCHTCWKREIYWAGKDGRRPRPGFRSEPRR
jgi:hypothetical protein